MVNDKYLVLTGEPSLRLAMRYKHCQKNVAWEYAQATVIWFSKSWEAKSAYEAIREDCKASGKKIVTRGQRMCEYDGITIYLRDGINWNVISKIEKGGYNESV